MDAVNGFPPDIEAFRFEPPDDYEEKLQQGYELLEFWPHDEMYENDKAVLDMTPSRAAIEAVNADLERAQELIREMQQARYRGQDEYGTSMVTMNFAGEMIGLEFSTDAVRMGNRELGEAIREAWQYAKEAQLEDTDRLNRIAGGMGGGVR
ncbi:hypothetical protein O1R50_25715 [Glycomyces luteolus]|uniref:YbaB/EbfC DNA-binding family protein n=1 Tax=Glycomyces luteolus TaxID=2670330 RepID=A0A9X3PDE3_9ACTN|nr:hypothetical protein [Glycomyces luteolus]MDA1363037.1 hypothetical protein [Glycomyces luteolus]